MIPDTLTTPTGHGTRRRFLGGLAAALAGSLVPRWVRASGGDQIQSSLPYLGEIMLVSFNFAPRGWALCNGQLLPINQNQALFSILGTTYGGNGQTTFALPDLRGRVAIHHGQGPGLSARSLGERAGEQTHTLVVSELPVHTHIARASSAAGTSAVPSPTMVPARNAAQIPEWSATANTAMGPGAIASAGGSQAHLNLHPHLALNYVIALQGQYPPP